MTDRASLADRPLDQRLALVSLAELEQEGTQSAHSGDLVQACRRVGNRAERGSFARVGEADMSRALNRLEADGIVDAATDDHSPVGKGRPAYSLAVDISTVNRIARNDDEIPDPETFGDW